MTMNHRFSLNGWLTAAVIGVALFGVDASATGAAEDPVVHLDLRVAVNPVEHQLEVLARFTLPVMDGGAPVGFFLNGALSIANLRVAGEPAEFVDPDTTVTPPGWTGEIEGPTPRFVRITPPAEAEPPVTVDVRYLGTIHDELAGPDRDYARSFASTSGLIDSAGVFLSGATVWTPYFPDHRLTFRMEVHLPSRFRSVSQGDMRVERGREIWECPHPQEEIYLIAGRYHVEEEEHAGVVMQTFTYEDDPELTGRYLEATADYLDMYTELLGPYPYGKFALVENFWQTGYGMPSFTLLGDQIIRMPWIISTSYGHEILHNWFGNGVYVVWERGNWCEGLTTYLADHLYKEQQGQGALYRRSTLRGYRDFVRDANDFALTDFRSRHDPVTQSVGYGKTMMVFHMLRLELGDELFVTALQRLVTDHMYRAADWADVRAAFETVAGRDLAWFFEQWVEQVGAPVLVLGEPEVTRTGDRYRVRAEIRQGSIDPYRLRVPVSLVVDGENEPRVEWLEISERATALELETDARPLALAVDPVFDVFRRLDRSEIPPALGELFGAERILFVLPAAADPAAVAAYRTMAETWAAGMDDVEIVSDVEIADPVGDTLPDLFQGRSVWLLGAANAFGSLFGDGMVDYRVELGADSVRVGGRGFPVAQHSVVLTSPHPTDPELSWGWVSTSVTEAVPGLTRKLPHYRRYGYLVFQGDEPTNVHKGEWPAVASPLVRLLAADIVADPAELPSPAPLIEKQLSFDAGKLMAHASVLASPAMEGRGIGTAGLDQAADYIAAQLRLAGLLPGGDDGYFQVWTQRLGPDDEEVTLRNVIGILPGSNADWQDECVVVGAHYDHLGRGWPDAHAGDEGTVHPGADDNASGVAVVLELARVMASSAPPSRSVVFAFFTAEEAHLVGSKHFVGDPPYALDHTLAMINLDTVGRLGDGKLLVFGANTTREMPHVMRGCGYVTGVPLDMGAPEVAASDQVAFQEAGVAAIHLFTGPHLDYHRPTDTVDQLDPVGMAQVAAFTREALNYLTARDEPLTPVGAVATSSPAPAASPHGGGRRVSLGTVPDFTFQGGGVRLDGTVPGSPAEAAGLREGDVVTRLGDQPITSLRDLSTALKHFEPGATTTVVYLREGVEHQAEVSLQAR